MPSKGCLYSWLFVVKTGNNYDKEKVNKVIKGLEKASKTHAQQAKTLKGIKFGKGDSASLKHQATMTLLYQR